MFDFFGKRKSSCVVLAYHRVTVLNKDPQRLAIAPKDFEKHIVFLKEHFNIISLQDLVPLIKTANVPPKTIVITFDDGYNDSFYYAKPILQKHGVPATVFVVAGTVNSHREFWWDELERIFLSDLDIYKDINIKIGIQIFSRKITDKMDAEKVYREIYSLLRYLPIDEINRVVNCLLEWSGLGPEGRKTHRGLTGDELRELVKEGDIEIGAHTMDHCVLSKESIDRQRSEIIGSRTALSNIINKEIKSFSYPFGSPEDVPPYSRNLLKEEGFNCAVAGEQGLVHNDADLFWIPRITLQNINSTDIQGKLSAFK